MFKFYITYFIVGAISFVIDLSIYTYLLKSCNVSWFYSNFISFIITTPVSFYLYNKYTYQKDLISRSITIKLLLFGISNIVAIILVQILMYLQIELFGFDAIKSKFSSSLFVIIINFLFRSIIIWKM
jgi:putative flippase GtrA